MPSSITFILPGLLDKNSLKFLDNTNLASMQRLTGLLSKSHKRAIGNLQQWFIEQYKVATNYSNSAYLMAQAQGIASFKDANYSWLRADPVILSVTHNGLYCRGNRVLNLTDEERDSLQSLVNEYFKEQSLELILADSKRGYIKYSGPVDCRFTPLSEIVGEDISKLLPCGENESFWHGLLTDLQMLLHNSDVNQQRMSTGLHTISGLWLWAEEKSAEAESHEAESSHEQNCSTCVMENIYSDDAALSGALGNAINLQQLSSHYESSALGGEEVIIYVSEFQDACLENDIDGWLALYQQWVVNWLLPALESVNNNNLQQVCLMTDDGFSYQYNSLSRWCFWRHHSFDINNKSTVFGEL